MIDREIPLSAQSSNRPGREAGFSIIESLVVLLVISIVSVSISNFFLGGKDLLAYESSRLAFTQDMVRVMMVTDENNVCEKLNFVNAGVSLQAAPNSVLKSLSELNLGPEFPIIKLGMSKNKRYEVKAIDLVQNSLIYAQNPSRAKAQIRVKVEFYDKKGKVVPRVKARDKEALAELILASDTGSVISSCYARFSRRIACLDLNGIYNPEATPNCSL